MDNRQKTIFVPEVWHFSISLLAGEFNIHKHGPKNVLELIHLGKFSGHFVDLKFGTNNGTDDTSKHAKF